MDIANALFGTSAKKRAQQRAEFGRYLRSLLISGGRGWESGRVLSSVVSEDDQYIGGLIDASYQLFIYAEFPGWSDLVQFPGHERERAWAIWRGVADRLLYAMDLEVTPPPLKFQPDYGQAILGRDSPFKFSNSFFNPNSSACGWWTEPASKGTYFVIRHSNQIVRLRLPSGPRVAQTTADEIFNAARDGFEPDEQYKFARSDFVPDGIGLVLDVDRQRFYDPGLTITWGNLRSKDGIGRSWLYVGGSETGDDGNAVLLMKSARDAERLYRAIRAPWLIAQEVAKGTKVYDLVDKIGRYIPSVLADELRIFIDETWPNRSAVASQGPTSVPGLT